MTAPGARLVIVGGPPASGKSTLARRLSGALDAVQLEPDRWIQELELDPLDSRARERVECLQAELTEQLLERGVCIVLDWGTFSRDKRDMLRRLARERGAAVELHFLTAAPDELWRRIRERDGDQAPTRTQFDAMLRDVDVPDAAERGAFDPPACSGPENG